MDMSVNGWWVMILVMVPALIRRLRLFPHKLQKIGSGIFERQGASVAHGKSFVAVDAGTSPRLAA
jgi:hypothetical protein